MKDILILYHSGAGCTKTISEVIYSNLIKDFEINSISINHPELSYQILCEYEILVLGFPTYHCRPSLSMLEFIRKITVFDQPLKAFVFTTFGLYSGNSLRIAIKQLYKKNIITLDYMRIKSPASDGAIILLSFLPFIFSFAKNSKHRIIKFISAIRKSHQTTSKLKIPHFKWYVPLNYINDVMGRINFNRYKKNLHIIEKRCINCQWCVKNCDRDCWIDGEITPKFYQKNCEFCLKCVHNCPRMAIVFSDKLKDKPRLNKNFFKIKMKDLI